MLTYKEGGTIIEGQWQNDKLSGICKVTNDKGETTECIYKNDMMIMTNNSGLTGTDWCMAVFQVIFILGFIACIPAALLVPDGMGIFVGCVIIYIASITWSCCHSATSYISNATSIKNIYADIERAINEKPTIMFHMCCYHFETRWEHYRDRDGHMHRRRRRVRVNTHRARKNHKIKKWEDQSPPAKTLHFLDVLMLTRLKTCKILHFTEKARKRVDKKAHKFVKKHDRDRYYDFSKRQEVCYALKSNVLVYNEKQGKRPWYTQYCILVALDFILLGWILRLMLNANSKIVEYEIKKLIKK